MAGKKRERFIVDTREKRPYPLRPSIEKALAAGDYSLEGFSEVFAIERKSFDDLFACLTSGQRRFKAQLRSLGSLRFSALVLDTVPAAILFGRPRCALPGSVALQRCIAWPAAEGVQTLFCGARGMDVVRVLLYHWRDAVVSAHDATKEA